jgi:hypothetical protein
LLNSERPPAVSFSDQPLINDFKKSLLVIFTYRNLLVAINDSSYHFIMYDETEWFNQQAANFMDKNKLVISDDCIKHELVIRTVHEI